MPPPDTRPPSRLQRARAFLIDEGYIWDWGVATVLIIINYTLPGPIIPAVQRWYSPTDPTLSYPMVKLELTGTEKFILLFGLPALIGGLVQIRKRSWHDWHNLQLATFEGLAVESSFKRWMGLVGHLRPDWLARVATGDPDNIIDGRMAYPSGHAAETMMGFLVLSLYLMAQLRLFHGHRRGAFGLAMLCLLPLGLAALIAMSRLTGYKHHFSDVNAGMGLGLCCGWLVYHLNFPSVLDPRCGRPLGSARAKPAAGLLGGGAADEAEAQAALNDPFLPHSSGAGGVR